MKTKRILAATLAALLVVLSMPLTAKAEAAWIDYDIASEIAKQMCFWYETTVVMDIMDQTGCSESEALLYYHKNTNVNVNLVTVSIVNKFPSFPISVQTDLLNCNKRLSHCSEATRDFLIGALIGEWCPDFGNDEPVTIEPEGGGAVKIMSETEFFAVKYYTNFYSVDNSNANKSLRDFIANLKTLGIKGAYIYGITLGNTTGTHKHQYCFISDGEISGNVTQGQKYRMNSKAPAGYDYAYVDVVNHFNCVWAAGGSTVISSSPFNLMLGSDDIYIHPVVYAEQVFIYFDADITYNYNQTVIINNTIYNITNEYPSEPTSTPGPTSSPTSSPTPTPVPTPTITTPTPWPTMSPPPVTPPSDDGWSIWDILNAIADFFNKLSGFFEGLVKGIGTLLEKFITSLGELLNGLIDSLVGALERLIKLLILPSDGFIELEFDKLKEKMSGKMSSDQYTTLISGLTDIADGSSDGQLFQPAHFNIMGHDIEFDWASPVNERIGMIRGLATACFSLLLIMMNYRKIVFLIRGSSPGGGE